MTHWASKYIGLPWAKGAQGPDSYDCWNFVREVLKSQFKVHVPIIEYETQRDVFDHLLHNPELDNWSEVESPLEGDVVMVARATIPAHVGLWIKANGKYGMLHCLNHIGVVFTPGTMIASGGWGRQTYYRRKT